MSVTPAGFGRLARSLLGMAERTAGGRIAFVLEGGYSLEALRDGVGEVLKALAGRTSPAGPLSPPSPGLSVELKEALRTFRGRWDIPAA